MSRKKPTGTVFKRGILGVQSGTTANLTVTKKNIIFVSKGTDTKSARKTK